MEHDPKALQQVLASAAPPDLDLSFRPMFGGVMAYAEGKAFASLSNVGLAVKATGALNAAFLAEPGARPLQYEPSMPPSKSYVLVPDAWLDDREALRAWIVRAAADLAAQPTKPKRKRA